MKGLNKVMLIGYVGSEPEIRSMQNGKKIATLSLATTESYKGKDGKKVDNTQWHKITIFDPMASSVAKYIKKGSALYIEGKISYSKEEKNGTTTYFTNIIASAINLLGSKNDASSKAGSQNDSNNSDNDEEIPF